MFKFKPTDEWYKKAAKAEEGFDISAGKECSCQTPDLHKVITDNKDVKISKCYKCHGFTIRQRK